LCPSSSVALRASNSGITLISLCSGRTSRTSCASGSSVAGHPRIALVPLFAASPGCPGDSSSSGCTGYPCITLVALYTCVACLTLDSGIALISLRPGGPYRSSNACVTLLAGIALTPSLATSAGITGNSRVSLYACRSRRALTNTGVTLLASITLAAGSSRVSLVASSRITLRACITLAASGPRIALISGSSIALHACGPSRASRADRACVALRSCASVALFSSVTLVALNASRASRPGTSVTSNSRVAFCTSSSSITFCTRNSRITLGTGPCIASYASIALSSGRPGVALGASASVTSDPRVTSNPSITGYSGISLVASTTGDAF